MGFPVRCYTRRCPPLPTVSTSAGLRPTPVARSFTFRAAGLRALRTIKSSAEASAGNSHQRAGRGRRPAGNRRRIGMASAAQRQGRPAADHRGAVQRWRKTRERLLARTDVAAGDGQLVGHGAGATRPPRHAGFRCRHARCGGGRTAALSTRLGSRGTGTRRHSRRRAAATTWVWKPRESRGLAAARSQGGPGPGADTTGAALRSAGARAPCSRSPTPLGRCELSPNTRRVAPRRRPKS